VKIIWNLLYSTSKNSSEASKDNLKRGDSSRLFFIDKKLKNKYCVVSIHNKIKTLIMNDQEKYFGKNTNQGKLRIIGGENCPLTRKVVDHLEASGPEFKGCLVDMNFKRHRNGEYEDHTKESIRDTDVYVIGFIPNKPCEIHDQLFRVLQWVNLAKDGAKARRVNLILPCMPYARSDKKDKSRQYPNIKLMIKLAQAVDVNNIITFDVHNPASVVASDSLMENVLTRSLFLNNIRQRFDTDLNRVVIVAPDSGASKGASYFAGALGCPLAMIHKTRVESGEVSEMRILQDGGDTEGKIAVLIDDMVDSGGTTARAAQALLDDGFSEVHAYAVHPILTEGSADKASAFENLSDKALFSVTFGNTCPVSEDFYDMDKFHQIDISQFLASAILNIHNGASLTDWSEGLGRLSGNGASDEYKNSIHSQLPPG
jgi:ribose-phosphate pyrophosphokinase